MDVLGKVGGTSEGQQVWAALALLASLRLWSPYWASQRSTVRVKSDSVSALILMMKLKTTGEGTSLIAREAALDIADAIYQPTVLEHIPGVTNTIADWLSREDVSSSASPLPSALRQARRRLYPDRNAAWWRTLDARTSA